MPRSYSSVYVHLVFATKDRNPYLTDPDFQLETHAYLGGISRTLGCLPVIVGGAADHVHILAALGKSRSQADWAKEVKRVSSIWVKERTPRLSEFSWQGGYGCFSVDRSNLEVVRRYIEGQEEPHRKVSFEDEFRTLLREHNIDFDERYLWE